VFNSNSNKIPYTVAVRIQKTVKHRCPYVGLSKTNSVLGPRFLAPDIMQNTSETFGGLIEINLLAISIKHGICPWALAWRWVWVSLIPETDDNTITGTSIFVLICGVCCEILSKHYPSRWSDCICEIFKHCSLEHWKSCWQEPLDSAPGSSCSAALSQAAHGPCLDEAHSDFHSLPLKYLNANAVVPISANLNVSISFSDYKKKCLVHAFPCGKCTLSTLLATAG